MKDRMYVTPGDNVPRLLRHVAKELAGEFFDGNRTPAFRNHWAGQRAYVKAMWPAYLVPAREVLINMLGQPGVHENLKEPIYDAILEDAEGASFRRVMQEVRTPS